MNKNENTSLKYLVTDTENTYVASLLKKVKHEGNSYYIMATEYIPDEDILDKFKRISHRADYYIGLDNMVIINKETKKYVSEQTDNKLYLEILEKFYGRNEDLWR